MWDHGNHNGDIPCPWIGRLNIVNIANYAKIDLYIQTITIKIPAESSLYTYRFLNFKILKLWKNVSSRAKAILRGKS